jgi:hypothetical protein
VPPGIAEAAAIDYAKTISVATGAGLVVDAKRVPVTQPLVHSIAVKSARENTHRHGSIYPEFKAALRAAANGPVKFYIGIRISGAESQAGASKLHRAEFISRNVFRYSPERRVAHRSGCRWEFGRKKRARSTTPTVRYTEDFSAPPQE